jgi:uncharacterized surface protein with fasciclin (FAS1) repeats
MRKLVFLIGLLLNGAVLLAQTTTTNTDSTVKQASKSSGSSLKKIEGATMLATNNIITNISTSPELSNFYKVIQATGLSETLTSQGPITVFAPNNQAFNNLTSGKLDTLLTPQRKYDLIAMITYHTLAGKVTSRDIVHQINTNKGLATFTTITGSKLMARLDTNRNIVLIDEHGGESVISKFDLEQSNGMIHIITGVLVPKFKTI